jgi:transposase
MSGEDDGKALQEALEVIKEQRRIIEALKREIAELKKQLEAARRAGKRQAGPFSRAELKPNPKPPGRKAGHPAAHRPVPERVDRTLRARLPILCQCGGCIKHADTQAQYQIDMPVPVPVQTTRFDVEIGHCLRCGKRHQGRHVEQTSDALGSAAVQMGPGLMGVASLLKHKHGLSYGAIGQLLEGLTGQRFARSSYVRADTRLAERLLGTYTRMVLQLKSGAVAYVDETGWRVGGAPAWLWVLANDAITVYAIEDSRGHEVIKDLLGSDFAGVLKADCFMAYDSKALAGIEHSKCLGHLIRRSREIEDSKSGRAVAFSRQVTVLLRTALRLRERRGQMSEHGAKVARGRLEAALDRLLAGSYSDPDNVRFARLLRRHRRSLFNFLDGPDVEATNNTAEREIRQAVIIRKTNGCNRTATGKCNHAVLASVIRSCFRLKRDFVRYVLSLLRQRGPAVLDFAVP